MANDSEDPRTELLLWFLADLAALRGASENTIQAYRRDLDRYVSTLGDTPLLDAAQQDVEDFVTALATAADGPPMSASSVARSLSAVRSFYKWAAKEGLTAQNPAQSVRPPKQDDTLPQALTVQEMTRLLSVFPVDGEPRDLRDRALLEFLYATGTRISEAVGLSVDDLDLSSDWSVVRVMGKGRKERLVPIGSHATAAIEAYLVRGRPTLAQAGVGTPALFLNLRGRPLSRQSAWEVIQTASKRASLGNDISPHTLRHTFATHLLEGGASVREVQELLGHASVSTTQIYTRLSPGALVEVYRSTHPRASDPASG